MVRLLAATLLLLTACQAGGPGDDQLAALAARITADVRTDLGPVMAGLSNKIDASTRTQNFDPWTMRIVALGAMGAVAGYPLLNRLAERWLVGRRKL